MSTLTVNNLNASSIGSVAFSSAIAENVFTMTGTALNPQNGTIQTLTLSVNVTLTDSLTSGQSMLLMINDGAGFSITWPTVTWGGGSAPTLATSGFTIIQLFKVGSTLYGSRVGAF
jgi:hypothetical protein